MLEYHHIQIFFNVYYYMHTYRGDVKRKTLIYTLKGQIMLIYQSDLENNVKHSGNKTIGSI